MLHSMTGYGDAQLETPEYSLLVEIKSLNNRFLKTVIRLPEPFSFAEPQIEKIIREELLRGSISYTLHLKFQDEQSGMEVNYGVLQGYLSQLERILTLRGKDAGFHVDAAQVFLLPGVCQPKTYSADQQQQIIHHIEDLTRQALQNLKHMRQEEGVSLRGDLHQNCKKMREHLVVLNELKDKAVQYYRGRLEQRVNMMLADANLKLDEEILTREVTLFAERSDIHEEVSRLTSHLDQFEEICETDGQAGRRLDFLTQEMLREANTIASKSNDANISQHVVEIKVSIDRLKEQVQNIE